MKCKKHPRYQVKRKPRSDCRYCHYAWNEKTTGCIFGERHDKAEVCDHMGRCMGCGLDKG